MRLFRQPTPGAWDAVMKCVEQALCNLQNEARIGEK
jgi:hypothetical protein